MRPIERGNIPRDDNDQIITVSNHRQWRKHLIDRIGKYCSYCEMALYDSPQVEHVIAQNIDSSRNLDWDNLVLACGPCNRTKSNTPCPPETHYLPDIHNTYLAFGHYLGNNTKTGEPAAYITTKSSSHSLMQIDKAINTINLCGLNKDTSSDVRTACDFRWKYRLEAITSALLWKQKWDDWGSHSHSQDFINLLCDAALGKGFFSIWFYIFEAEPSIKKSLIEAFPNTALDCFDSSNDYNPVARNAPDDI
ncbi:HNH endonuclease signature motif containing protein [Aureispira anguillae]|uniref:HNH endonuclease n=1 Tax=Aureispira anguillae TaxID=2864201 RepID=A0A916DS26_9BACT|nr:HNH endonuclease signature motif containing protein [Aureispira anguillae]BDS11616.1 HNH endonuclease [Aureispira anguillae]